MKEKSMTRQQIKKMVLELVGAIDYDIAKDYDVKTAEEPEYVEGRVEELIEIVEKHLAKVKK